MKWKARRQKRLVWWICSIQYLFWATRIEANVSTASRYCMVLKGWVKLSQSLFSLLQIIRYLFHWYFIWTTLIIKFFKLLFLSMRSSWCLWFLIHWSVGRMLWMDRFIEWGQWLSSVFIWLWQSPSISFLWHWCIHI